jgi:hypothetical protein
LLVKSYSWHLNAGLARDLADRKCAAHFECLLLLL